MTEVDLSPYFSEAAGAALLHPNEAELAISRAFASAANAGSEEPVAVQLRIARAALPAWTRQAKDVVLRCVDRAVTRVFPPLDVLQYLGADSPVFEDAPPSPSSRASGVCVVFRVQPSAKLWPASLFKPHTVEGEAVAAAPVCGPEASAAAAALQSMQDTLSDMDLWNRARAAQQLYDASLAADETASPEAPATGSPTALASAAGTAAALQAQERARAEKLTQLRWQLARWLTELFLNEGSWARPHASSAVGGSVSAKSNSRGGAAAAAEGASRRLFQGPMRPVYAHVVEAALAAPAAPSSDTAAPAAPVPRRFLHADVRGVEWDGLLLGYTTRYAYIAVPYHVSASAAASTAATAAPCVWCLVSRIPVPAVLAASPADAAPAPTPAGSHDRPARKRARPSEAETDDGTPAAAAAAVLARCLNVDAVMRHDTAAAESFRLAGVPCVVTVRAHRAYCARADPATLPAAAKTVNPHAGTATPAASPYALSLVLEDAYALRVRPVAPAAADVAADASAPHWAVSLVDGGHDSAARWGDLTHTTHTFPDVVSVVRESCHRFQRAQERFSALYTRSAEARRPAAAAAASAVDVGETAEALSPAAAAQNLRLLRQAETVYGALADSVSVHFKKLRGAARPPIPVVRTTADVAQLEEGPAVEFKAKVSLPTGAGSRGSDAARARQPALMDTERLRNTMAAMAACRGGVIVVGVADDGRLLGHAKQLEVARQLRISGFCPAMVKDTVQVKELRWLGAVAGDGVGPDGTAASAKRSMPANWWKGGAQAAASGTPPAGGASSNGKAAAGAGDELVITVVSVEKGQAPFYATARNAPPYQRGCASTTVMPTMVAARRIMKELA